MRLTRRLVLISAFAVLAAALFLMSISTAAGRRKGVSSANAARCPARLVEGPTMPFTSKLPYFITDIDCDGDDDLLMNEPDRLLWYRLHESGMTLAGEMVYEQPGCTRMVADADGDGRREFFVLAETPKGTMVSCHDWFSAGGPSEPVYTVEPLIPPLESKDRPWRRINFLGSWPAGAEAHPYVFLGLNYLKIDERPRWLVAFDGVTGKELWRFCFGPQSQELISGTFGGATQRVVFTTSAVHNGVSCNGTVDSLSYVFCLDGRDGRLLWKQRITGWAGRGYLAAADVNADGHDEILVGRYVAKRDSSIFDASRPWSVEALGGDGEVLFTGAPPVRFESFRVANLDGSPSPEIVVEGADGKVAILNHDLTVRRILQPPVSAAEASFRMLGLWDLEGRGRAALVCQLDSMLFVRDQKGKVIAQRMFTPLMQVRFARYDGKNHVMVVSGDSIHAMALERLPLATRLRANARRLASGAAAAMLIGIWAVFHARRLLRRRRERHMNLDVEQNELLTAMSAFGHGGSSLKVLDRLRLHLKNWERIRADGMTKEELFARLHKTFGETVVPELERLVMLARKASAPESSWSPLLAEAKLADEEIVAILASGSEGARQKEHIAKALAALDGVDESIAGIRSHLRAVFRTPVAEALERLIARFRFEQGEGGASFVFASQDAAAGAVYLSPVSFDKIFEALLSNAVRATEGRAGAEITIAIQIEGNYCRIDVRDNGCGIARENWERIFDRHFTTKPEGGGFGLYYAREELAKFGGKIFVGDSVVGSETTMRTIIRRSEKAGTA